MIIGIEIESKVFIDGQRIGGISIAMSSKNMPAALDQLKVDLAEFIQRLEDSKP